MSFLSWLAVTSALLASGFPFSFDGKIPAPNLVETPFVPIPLIIPPIEAIAADAVVSATSSVVTAPATEVPATTTPEKLVPKPITPSATPGPIVSDTPPPKAKVPEEDDTGSASMRKVRGALVNIVCTTKNPTLRPMSGTGVFIDSRGIILTVAHIAQYFLLTDAPKEGTVSCVIRTGSPARTAYTAKLIYVSESWVAKNPTTLIEETARGTGEHDFALLAVTGSATEEPLPDSFPALSINSKKVKEGASVIIGSYGAQFISSKEVLTSLYPTLISDVVKDIYTFRDNTIDVLAFGGNAAAQLGSSGGAITDMDGALIGIITTSTVEGPIHARNMRAITPYHIRTSFSKDTDADFDSFLMAGTPSALSSSFQNDMFKLTAFLMGSIGL